MSAAKITSEGAITVITLTSGHAGNRLDPSQVESMTRAFEDLASQKLSCVLIHAEGSFCEGRVGHSDMSDQDAIEARVSQTTAFFSAFASIPGPKVSHVKGKALGFGANLAIQADLVVVDPDASLGFPEIAGGFAPLLALNTLLGYVRPRDALWLVSTGESVDATRAVELGLATEIGHMSTALDRAAWLAANRESWQTAYKFVEQNADRSKQERSRNAPPAMVNELLRSLGI